MVATRRGTRVDPQEEAVGSGGEQTAVEPATPASPKRAQRSVQSDTLAQESGGNSQGQGDSTLTIGSPTKNDSSKGPSQVVTRGRHRSGQSDADVSEAESTTSNSSTRVTRSRQSLGNITDSARKLRSHRSAFITEPILESKEDEALSEAESYCSSVSTRASRRTRASASNLNRARSRKSALPYETVSDHSEAESNCSSVSGLQNTAIRSIRTSAATCPLTVNCESQKDEISEAESCNSDFVSHARTRRSSRRIQSKPQADEAKNVSEASSQEQESPKKQRYTLRGVKVIEPLSSVQEEKMLSTPRRSLRNRIVNEECSNIIVLSDSDSQTKTFSSKHEHVDQPADQKSVKEKHSLSVEPCSILDKKLPETSQSTVNDAPDEMIDLTEDSMDKPQLKEQDKGKADDDDDDDDDNVSETADITNTDFPNKNTASQSGKSDASNITERVEISLVLDSDESEDSEHSEEEEDDVEMEEVGNQKELEQEKNHEGLVKKKNLKPTSTVQSKDLLDNRLFVIDTAPGLDSSKKYYVDHDVDDSESEGEQSEKKELSEPEEALPEPDDEEEDFIDEEVDDDDDDEDELLNKPKTGFDLSSRIDTGLSMKQLGGLYISFDAEKPNPGPSLINKMKKESRKKDELLKKSVITPDFEKKESVPPYSVSLHKLKKQRKEEREKTTGRGWFDMKAPEMTEELKNDLKALKMRSAMDPKHFYKKDDREGFPKYFQVATVVDNPLDYYHSRIPKKQRKRTIVEELLADSEFRRYNKKKYQEIMAEKAARVEGKKNRKKKKFRT